MVDITTFIKGSFPIYCGKEIKGKLDKMSRVHEINIGNICFNLFTDILTCPSM